MEMFGSSLSLPKKERASHPENNVRSRFFRRAITCAALAVLGTAMAISSCKKEEMPEPAPAPKPAPVRFIGDVSDTIGLLPISKTLAEGDTMFYSPGKFGFIFLGLKSNVFGDAVVSLLDSTGRGMPMPEYLPDTVYLAEVIPVKTGKLVHAYEKKYILWVPDTYVGSDSTEYMRAQITTVLSK